MEKSKKKKSLASRILAIVGVLFLIIAVAATTAANVFSGVLDKYVGVGEAKVTVKEGAENWDSTYYTADYSTAEEIDTNAKNVTREIAGEGMTLLKNNDQTLPMLTSVTGGADQNISVFGRRSVDTVWGGTGSGSGDSSQCISIEDALTSAGFNVNPTLTQMYTDNLDKVEVASNTMDKLSAMTYYIGEFPMTYYDSSVTATYASYHDAAVIVFGRQGGEGMDFSTNLKESLTSGETAMSSDVAETANYEDGQHQLELNYEEKQLLAHVEENFDKVIVVINSSNVMELGDLQNDDQVDAIVWMAYPGSTGTEALAGILNGSINPSGHTVDTWPTDLTADPSFNNATTVAYTNVDSSNARETSYMVEYEEGIYVGYRYYETAGALGAIDYDQAVVYPFGYGLSYTSFSQEITNVEDADGTINVTVKVTNTGDAYSGKDVIQIYAHAPYTGSIEKAEQVLVGYDKTDLLAPGESGEYTISFSEEDLASYDYQNEGCYVLEAGDYEITVRKNAHSIYGDNCSYTHTVSSTVVYDESNPRQTEIEAQTGDLVNLTDETKAEITVQAAVNQFEEENNHFVSYTDSNANNGYAVNMTREDFTASFPTAPTAADLTASEEVIANLGDYTPDYLNSEDEMPVTGADNGINAVALRGKTYDDPMWEELLDQLTVKDMTSLICAGNQGTVAVKSISLPASTATDGPAGLKQYGGLGLGVSGNFNCCGTLVAASWNDELAEAYGESIGNESVQASMTGWYAPGVDIHRTAFGGRNFEYYSEDPLLSGCTCAATIQGSANKGVICYFKHFALNDVETHREDNAPCVWANEQAMREIYLKAFEIAVKTPAVELKYLDEEGNTQTKKMRACTGIMTSFNRIGSVWTGDCDALVTTVLRDEWGFIGTVITDYNDEPQMDVEAGVASGNDLMLANVTTLQSSFRDTSNASTVKAMRQAVKNIVYSLINSNCVNGMSDSTIVTYGMAPWKMALYIGDAVLVILGVLFLFLSMRKKKKCIEKAVD